MLFPIHHGHAVIQLPQGLVDAYSAFEISHQNIVCAQGIADAPEEGGMLKIKV